MAHVVGRMPLQARGRFARRAQAQADQRAHAAPGHGSRGAPRGLPSNARHRARPHGGRRAEQSCGIGRGAGHGPRVRPRVGRREQSSCRRRRPVGFRPGLLGATHARRAAATHPRKIWKRLSLYDLFRPRLAIRAEATKTHGRASAPARPCACQAPARVMVLVMIPELRSGSCRAIKKAMPSRLTTGASLPMREL
jgi:hypothetical protein